ncbi:MAG: glycosyltransferase, partial [Candidatus Neomarinimicrobiota bacterium]
MFQNFLIKYFTGEFTYLDFPAQFSFYKYKFIFIKQYAKVKESIVIDSRKNEEIIRRIIGLKFIKGLVSKLKSPFKFDRIKAAVYLGMIRTFRVQQKLILALKNESDFTVKQYIANALADTENPDVVPHLIESLPGSSPAYRIFTINLIINFGDSVYELIRPLLKSKKIEFKYLILSYCKMHLTRALEDFIVSVAISENSELANYAARILLDHHHHLLVTEDFLEANNQEVRSLAVQALGRTNEKQNIIRLIEFLGDPSVAEDAVVGLSGLLRQRPLFIPFLVERFENEGEPEKKLLLAKVLSFRIEYFLANIFSSDGLMVKSLIKETLKLGQSSAIIGFLNRNNDQKLENEIISIIGEVSKNDKLFEIELQYHLNEDILEKLGLQRVKLEQKRVVPEKDLTSIRILWATLIITILFMPAFFLFTNWPLFAGSTITNNIKLFILQFNYGMVFYSSTINLLYIVLLSISAWGIYKQRKYWNIKEISFLFKPGILPSISIIAPAYNEVANIIESTSSLLNLKYPRYEVVVVNDGSKDDTLNRIIE